MACRRTTPSTSSTTLAGTTPFTRPGSFVRRPPQVTSARRSTTQGSIGSFPVPIDPHHALRRPPVRPITDRGCTAVDFRWDFQTAHPKEPPRAVDEATRVIRCEGLLRCLQEEQSRPTVVCAALPLHRRGPPRKLDAYDPRRQAFQSAQQVIGAGQQPLSLDKPNSLTTGSRARRLPMAPWYAPASQGPTPALRDISDAPGRRSNVRRRGH